MYGREHLTLFWGYLQYCVLWTCWCGAHSLLVNRKISGRIEYLLGTAGRFYRMVYNLFSLVTIAPLLFSYRQLSMNADPLFEWDGWSATVRYSAIFIALYLFIGGAKNYDLRHFLGIAQLKTGHSSVVLGERGSFKVSGVSRIVRHPWYLGGILISWTGFPQIYPVTLITAVIVTIYFIVGSMLEERKLIDYGDSSYRLYQQDVSMLVPVKWFRSVLLKKTGGKRNGS